ncbi:MAG: DNA oxidative demethylase AlkB [Methylophaga nitratireducenticrescens]|uniref:DNA oxidative demethylase AlkB n=1 Tax=Methylophaga sp. SB9B TaxID=2570356 RepID=UPI0010A7559D|nr:DNA oxidative demethylase AlkB [Methylophaga sp. SB9B]THF54769.1 MAG: DNA oxidative demethylase AlkB [Methylophaga nitratireducenticrescens]THK42045.1 DNA oxidative demethylase AlkB [Methylophaga sp. SB9B]
MITADLFAEANQRQCEQILPEVFLLRSFALQMAPQLLNQLDALSAESPFRRMQTPGGFYMSTAITNCGDVGWHSDRQGYRYSEIDPQTQQAWPAMPESFRELAETAAQQSGFSRFSPDVCLINRYEVGAKMGLHQDKDEKDFSQPIVSVSLGLPILFQFGGPKRNDPVQRIPLQHGDVIVWGGAARRYYHGVLTLKPGQHPLTGSYRYNLTFRQAR